MKYGLLFHKPTLNIGDDIQSYAIKQFMPHVDYLIDREKIGKFKTKDEKPVAVIMAAWWMWEKWNWPPSKFIYPLFVGFHYSDNKAAKQAGCPADYLFMKGLGAKYLNANGPIGCRDYYTRDRLKELGVNADFSGCITITLPEQKRIKPEKEYVCLVDVAGPVQKKVRQELEGTDIEVKVIKHDVDTEHRKKPFEQRMQETEELLTLYQNAKCVITRRLHCALPCLAMGVPVLLAMHTAESIRFKPYYDWLNFCIPIDYVKGNYEYDVKNPPPNPTVHIEYKEKLEKRIKEFIAETEKLDDPSADELKKLKKSERRILRFRNSTMKKTIKIWEKELNGDLNEKEIEKNAPIKENIKKYRFRLWRQTPHLEKLLSNYLDQARRIYNSPEKTEERKRAREAAKKAKLEAEQAAQNK